MVLLTWNIPYILSTRYRRRCNICPRIFDRKAKMKCFVCCQTYCKNHIRFYCVFCFQKFFDESFVQTTNMEEGQRKNIQTNFKIRRRCSHCLMKPPKIASKRCNDCNIFLCKNHCHMICVKCINIWVCIFSTRCLLWMLFVSKYDKKIYFVVRFYNLSLCLIRIQCIYFACILLIASLENNHFRKQYHIY